jgi:thiol:disulfide interchange protein DsbC
MDISPNGGEPVRHVPGKKGGFLNRFYRGLFALLAVLATAFPSYAFKEGGGDCLKCHVLSEKDMAPVLLNINMPQAKILAVRMSPIKGLWEIAAENKGQRFLIYMDFSRKYISAGPFIDYANRKDVTRERIDELNRDRKVSVEGLSLRDALVIGKADAAVRVIVFTDPG